MAHLDQTYDSFEKFLTPEDDAPYTLEGVWSVDLAPLNSSGVTGSVVFAMSTEGDGTPILNVSLAAEGLTPNQPHAQHIHGRFFDDGTPRDSVSPTIADDADRDGIVEVLEGLGRYGDILLPLMNDNGMFPTADGNGELVFLNTFDLNNAENLVSPVTGTQYSAEDLMPLMLREVVVHGIDVPEGIGEGTGGEVDGDNGFVGILPASAGDIEVTSVEEALRLLDEQREIASDAIFVEANNAEILGGAGDDSIFGNGDDNRLFGQAGDDNVFGFGGDDVVGGGAGDDFVGGGAGNDEVYGAAGNDTVFGVEGADVVAGGMGDDNAFGGTGNDTVYGGAGDDVVAGGAGADLLFGGLGRDAVDGGTGDDVLNAGPDDNLDGASDDGASGSLSFDDYDNGYAGGAGDDTINGGDGDDIITGDDDSRVSNQAGTAFNMEADGADVIFGGGGNDEIHTGTWADSDNGFDDAQSGTSGDFASGGDGNDIIRGAGGDDTLRGDAGDDDIGGGGGADTFTHSGSDGDGFDTIIDYDDDEGDVLRVNDSDAEEDDFEFSFDDGDDSDNDSDDSLIVSYNGTEIFELNGFQEGDDVTIETPDETFTFTPMDDMLIG